MSTNAEGRWSLTNDPLWLGHCPLLVRNCQRRLRPFGPPPVSKVPVRRHGQLVTFVHAEAMLLTGQLLHLVHPGKENFWGKSHSIRSRGTGRPALAFPPNVGYRADVNIRRIPL